MHCRILFCVVISIVEAEATYVKPLEECIFITGADNLLD